jgi:hypothetical protein
MEITPNQVYIITHAGVSFEVTFNRTEIDNDGVQLVFEKEGCECWISGQLITTNPPNAGEFLITQKPSKYAVADIELDLMRAGVNLDIETRRRFSNFNDEGCFKAIEWIFNNAPWTDKNTDFAELEKQYLSRFSNFN